MRESFSRRQLLRSALGGLLLAPFLRERALQAQNALPKRLVLLFSPDSNPPEWWPTVGGGDFGFTLGEPLADFAGLEEHMLFVRQLDHSWTFDNHHIAGIVQLFTGQERGSNDFANGASLDQVLLQETEIRAGTARPSVHLGVDDGRTDTRHTICYTGPSQPIINEIDPVRAFDDVFDGVTFGAAAPTEPAPAPTVSPTALARQRQIDVNMDEVREIQRYLGQEEKEKLELHLTSLEELRARIETTTAGSTGAVQSAACEEVATSSFSSRDLTNEERITEWAKMQADIIKNAFTCDRTRVASLSFSFSGGHHNGLLGFSGSWHDDVAHVSREDDSLSVGGETMTSRQAFNRFSRFWGGQFAYLAQSLAQIQEGDGSMLDNTLIVWGVESGTNHNHSPRDMQYLMVGGRNLGIQTGQFLQPSSTQSAHTLHTSILNAFGHPATGFGIEPDCGPLAGFLA
jgi:hypothetical protein